MTTWHIKRTGEDRFQITGRDQFTRIEEDVDGPNLMGMLAAKEAGESNVTPAV